MEEHITYGLEVQVLRELERPGHKETLTICLAGDSRGQVAE
jgi:hypothetical protein